jgi:Abnormal spindle-like microcephaly-assoc'd, ASPM-SPD-2-Hydin
MYEMDMGKKIKTLVVAMILTISSFWVSVSVQAAPDPIGGATHATVLQDRFLNSNVGFQTKVEAAETSNDMTFQSYFVNRDSGSEGPAYYKRRNFDDHNHLTLAQATSSPDITVSQLSHAFGDVLTNTGVSLIFEIRNDGNGSLNITGTGIVGSAEFTVTDGDVGTGINLAPGQSHSLQVTFRPTASGAQNETLRITSNDPDEGVVDIVLDGRGVDTTSSATVAFEEAVTGGSTGSTMVATSSAPAAVNDHLYLAAISSKSYRPVTSVTGMGLNWILVDAQCGGRNATGVEVWMALGRPMVSEPVTATLSSNRSNATITVARYSGVDPANPIGNPVTANTIGMDGDCSGGNDADAYHLSLPTTMNNSVVYAAIAMRHRSHTPGAGFTERIEFVQGDGGAAASVATMDQIVPVASTVVIEGAFSSIVDFAVIGLEILPRP